MRIIITGGTGFIGSALARRLASQHEVILLSRSLKKSDGVPPSVQIVRWDAQTAEGWGDLADGAGALVNLAGENIGGTGFLPPRWSPDLKKRILESRLNAGRAVIEAIRAAKKKPGVLIQSSAVGYYGVHQDEKITESSPAGKDFLADVCVQWEMSTEEAEKLGVRRAVIRIGLPLSNDGGVFTRLVLPFRLFAGGSLGNGKQYMSWIAMDDYLDAIQFLIDRPDARGVFNLTSPNPVTNAEFARALGRAMKRPAFMPAPGFVFRVAFGEVSTLILDGQRVIPEHLQKAGFAFKYPTIETALATLV